VIFVDEAQDLSLLEMRLIKKWAKRCEHLVMAGDPFQSIFSFKGADPAVMDGTPLPKEHRPVLHQSYRVSREVHRVAMRFLELMPGYRPIEYLPTEQDGYSQICPLADWRNPEPAIDRVEQIIDRGESVMVLASCSYMIDRVKAELRSRAIPFHNPYRRRRGDWNPLVPRKGVSSADRVAAFLSQRLNGGWTMAEAQKWSDPLVDVIFRKGVKKMIRDWVIDKDGGGFVPDPDAAECSNWFRSPADAERALKRDLEWYQKHLLGSKVQPMTFPLRIADERGAGALKESPQVVIGSIHSVKGGEADHVILFPDLSPEAFAASAESEERLAEAFRVFYVGITRARQGVILCDDCGRFARGGPMPYLEEAFH
jgi:superfamily I DNA/RNA helicase